VNEELIAPCGMNCGICSAYLALKNDIKSKGIGMPYCIGCRPRNKQCAFLKKRCSLLLENHVQYCYECRDYPCENLNRIDKRYSTLYRMSMIENLKYIWDYGVGQFLENQEATWKCPKCGEVICCHNGICFNCGLGDLKTRKKLYRWEDD